MLSKTVNGITIRIGRKWQDSIGDIYRDITICKKGEEKIRNIAICMCEEAKILLRQFLKGLPDD